MIGKLRNILEGWKGYAFPDEDTEKEAKKRAEICAQCDSAKPVDGMDRVLPDPDNKQAEGMKCVECGCPLSSKLRAMDEECPLKKW